MAEVQLITPLRAMRTNLVFFILLVCGQSAEDTCFHKETNRSGKCLLLINCTYAFQGILNQKDPQVCRLGETAPIVCCPDNPPSVSDVVFPTSENTEAEDTCFHKDTNGSGKCLPLINCTYAFQGILKQKDPQVCRLGKTAPIVCCPDNPQSVSDVVFPTSKNTEDYPPQINAKAYQPQVATREGDVATLNCAVQGNPNPTISWVKDNLIIDGKQPRYRLLLDGILQIITVEKTDSGIYVCTADNGLGRPLQNEIRLNVTVPVRTNITMPQTAFGFGSDINIPCDVDGYPIPNVQWYKDNQSIVPTERIEITESNSLILRKAIQTDSGVYRCEAYNQYYRSESTTSLTVEGIYIHPNCTDNPFFADCTKIVQAKWCSHVYYARFCCKSCTEHGQLPSHRPDLDNRI